MKVYLAGPEIFMPDFRAQIDRKIALARAAGFIPLSPGDIPIPEMPTPHAFGLAISAVDEEMMDASDAIIANITPLRGIAADAGTAFELGYMCGRGKIVYAYSNVADDYSTRLRAYYGGKTHRFDDGRERGPDGFSLEDFDMADNLMLDGGVERRGGVVVRRDVPEGERYTDTAAFEECLRLLAARAAAERRE
jgi:nucleoside 2-deoxyribosyltransferase